MTEPAAGGTPAPPSSSESPARTLAVADVANRLGIEPRTVRRWCNPRGSYAGRLCPHDRVKARVGGNDSGETIRMNLDEVRAWCEAQGVGKPKRLEDRERAENGPVEWTVAGEVIGPRAEGRGLRQGTGSGNRESGLGLEGSTSALGPVTSALSSLDDRTALRMQIEALAGVVHGLQVSLEEMRRSGEMKGISTANLQQAVSAAVNISRELRQVDALDLERQKARGELVLRGAAETVVRRTVEGVTTSLETLRQDVSEALAADGCQVGAVAGEAFERWAYAKLEALFDAARVRVADELMAEGEATAPESSRPGREAA